MSSKCKCPALTTGSKCKCPAPPTVPATGSSKVSQKIYFVLSARDLPNKERGCLGSTVQDPFVKWSQNQEVKTDPFKQVGVTSHKVNDPNPDWYDTVFSFEWIRGTGQLWHFDVMDQDPVNKNDPIAFVDIDVDDYVLQKNQELSVKLSTSQGTLLIKKCAPVYFRLEATDLPKLDPFNGLSDPYVKCYWSFGQTGPQTLFATTKTIKNVENATWDEVIEFPNYQEGTNQFWTFKVFDKDTLPKDDVVGEGSVDVDSYIKLRKLTALKLSKDAENISQLLVVPATL